MTSKPNHENNKIAFHPATHAYVYIYCSHASRIIGPDDILHACRARAKCACIYYYPAAQVVRSTTAADLYAASTGGYDPPSVTHSNAAKCPGRRSHAERYTTDSYCANMVRGCGEKSFLHQINSEISQVKLDYTIANPSSHFRFSRRVYFLRATKTSNKQCQLQILLPMETDAEHAWSFCFVIINIVYVSIFIFLIL